MRIRQLRKMGFKVMVVDYSQASRLQVHPKQLREYLQECYMEARNQQPAS